MQLLRRCRSAPSADNLRVGRPRPGTAGTTIGWPLHSVAASSEFATLLAPLHCLSVGDLVYMPGYTPFAFLATRFLEDFPTGLAANSEELAEPKQCYGKRSHVQPHSSLDLSSAGQTGRVGRKGWVVPKETTCTHDLMPLMPEIPSRNSVL